MNVFKGLSFASLLRKAQADYTSRTAEGATDQGTAVKFDESVRKQYGIEVQFQALPIMRFFQFARLKDDLTKQPGQLIEVMLYDNLARGGKLTEGTNMQAKALGGSLKEVRVYEHGNAVEVTEFNLKTSFRDTLADATKLLSRDFAVTLDCLLRDTAVGGTQQIISRRTKAIAMPADTSTIANANLADYSMSITAVDDATEILATANTPKFNGDHYVGMLSPHQARDLKDDPNWEKWNQYTNPEAKYHGEIGRIEDTRFIETTLMPQGARVGDTDSYDATLKSTHADNVPLYKGIIFGEDYYALAVALYPELRDDGVKDYGRKHGIAWYGIFGSGILHEDRGVTITTT